jgi:hypothetical protein
MTKRLGKGGSTLGDHVLPGQRETLERELLWAIALGGDRSRIEQLERMLTPAANDAFETRVVSTATPNRGSLSGSKAVQVNASEATDC